MTELRYSAKGALLFDMDGTFFLFGTQTPAPGAVDTMQRLTQEGYLIYFVTRRHVDDPVLGSVATKKVLLENGVKYEGMLWGVPSPRLIVDDKGVAAVEHERNGVLDYAVLAARVDSVSHR